MVPVTDLDDDVFFVFSDVSFDLHVNQFGNVPSTVNEQYDSANCNLSVPLLGKKSY